MNNPRIQLYRFKHFDMDCFFAAYLDELAPKEEVLDIDMLTGSGVFCQRPAQKGVKDTYKIRRKCLFLQDALIRRAHEDPDHHTFTLSSAVLKYSIGNEYRALLQAFIRIGMLERGDGFSGADHYYYFEPGSYSCLYSLPASEVFPWYTRDHTLIKYKKRALEKAQEVRREIIRPAVESRYGADFTRHYVAALNHFTLALPEKYKTYLNENGYDREGSPAYVYYRGVEARLMDKHKDIYSIDGTGRIYHSLTSLKTDVKKYINIDFSIDCRNSHPVLFNYFIFHHHQIPIETSYMICRILKTHSPYIYHNVSKYLRNKLNDSNIEKLEIAKLSDNELEYIYLTCSGLLWDELMCAFPAFDRKSIKCRAFAEIYYGASRPKGDLAKAFVARFPDVYALIQKWKRPSNGDIQAYLDKAHLSPRKEYASLSLALMHLEAQVFTNVLKRMYKKRWSAINIHDCIVVPLTNKKCRPTLMDVTKIMLDEFEKIGLCPSFS